MQPTFDMRIRTMMKAMTNVVMPAIDPSNRAALEQAGLVAASLDMLIEQIDYCHWFEVADVRSHAELAEMLVPLRDFGPSKKAAAVTQSALALALRDEVTLAEIREQGRLLRDVICDLIEGLAGLNDPALQNSVNVMVISHAERQVSRERAFVAKTKFDVYPDSLLPMREAMERPLVISAR